MPAILQRQSEPQPPLAARGSPIDWDSWTTSQQGGVLAASLLVFLFFFGLGAYLWQRRRERKRRERRASRSRGRSRTRRHTKKRRVSDTPSPPRKKQRKTKRLKSKGKAESPGPMMMQGALATPEKTSKEENKDTPDRAEEVDQCENKSADASLDRANIRLERRRERRREARRRAAPKGYVSAAGRAIKARLDAPASKTKGEPSSVNSISGDVIGRGGKTLAKNFNFDLLIAKDETTNRITTQPAYDISLRVMTMPLFCLYI